uniref:Carboxylesterase type B domain-containing protein n=1 Tax=Moniliophthora roreri TaxID=221103 RepID=A0A0W0F594_MONRR
MFAFMMTAYFLPTYFQILGSSAIMSGIEMLPFSLVSSIMALISGLIVAKTGEYRTMIWAGFVVMTLGFGLMIQLDDLSSRAEKELYPFVAALGLGCLFQVPTVAFQASMPLADMAASTTAFILFRTLCGSIGLSVGNVIFANTLKKKLAEQAPDYNASAKSISQLTNELRDLPPELRQRVLHAYTKSVSLMWIVCTPIVFVAFIMVLFLRSYSLKRAVVRTGSDEKKGSNASPSRSSKDEKAQDDAQVPTLTRGDEKISRSKPRFGLRSSSTPMRTSRLVTVLFSCTLGAFGAPQVKLGNTTVVGREDTILGLAKLDFFGGIPFAEPPLGKLRLKRPVLKTSPGGQTFDASQFGPACLQPGQPVTAVSEDCLTINVFRPSGISADAKLPVLFWTYGGGFQGGAASIYNASAIVATGVARGTPLIYVNYNYRLGPLGFPQGAEAQRRDVLNLALSDQVAALEWVQRNIGTFGGDKTKVTVFGESAGAIMTAAQFLNPYFSKWARAGIFESGSAATAHLLTGQEREGSWTSFVKAVPECAALVGSNDTFDCLQSVNSSSILQGLVASIAEASELFPWSPAIDGPGGFIPDLPSRLFKKGIFARLPFIAGTNLDEGTFVTPESPGFDYSTENLRNSIIANLSPPDVSPQQLASAAERLTELYPDVPALGSPFNTGNETFGLPSGYKRFAALNGDVAFQSQRRFWQQTMASAGIRTFGYLFTQPTPGIDPALGVAHGTEVPFVYGLPLVTPNATASATRISQVMIEYWVSFATSLNPNDGKGRPRPVWSQYTPQNQVLIQLNGDNTTLIPDNYRQEQISFINQNPVTFAHRRSLL